MFLSPSRRWILKSLICSRAVTAEKSTIKRDARAKLLFCQSKPIALFPFSMASPSAFLKLPNGYISPGRVI